MKKAIITGVCILLAFCVLMQTGMLKQIGIYPFRYKNSDKIESDKFEYVTERGIKYRVRAEGNYLQVYTGGKWQNMFLKGVNIGAGEPGLFPGDLAISYETYYEWFGLISEMNANSIRIYTTMGPQFYTALLDFNSKAENPIYLFQGVWINEEDIETYADVYAENNKIMTEFIDDTKDVIDALFGNITLPNRAGFASGEYTADVSKYLGGFVLGIEEEPNFVINTNTNNPDKNSYDGKYMYTVSASPFEAFLCRAGDEAIQYITEQYGIQVPVSFTNWITDDPLTHPNEPHPDEDSVTINVENIKCRDEFFPKQFATYHVYPYYPDSLNYQVDYLKFLDSSNKVNTYQAYLRDLKNAHTMPIVVGEFGIPTSRGMGHESVMGYNQGNVDEADVGPMLIDMFRAMYEENYAGGMVFSWQDEWFKRTWNNVKFDIPDKRPFWANVQTCEQFFGLLAFDPGEDKVTCVVDGLNNDWKGEAPVSVGSAGKLYMKSDEKNIYFMVESDSSINIEKDTIYIPIDTKDSQGNTIFKDSSITFDKPADFLIEVNGKENTRILVDSYYDVFYFLYFHQYKMGEAIQDITVKNSGRFNKIRMCYGYEMNIPPENTVVPFKSFETGKLKYGTNDPESKDYKSLTDFSYKGNVIEIAIPWQLLNVMDPSGKKIMDDFYTAQSITAADSTPFAVGLGSSKSTNISLNGSFDWNSWTIPTYHQRLKPAYYHLQKELVKFK